MLSIGLQETRWGKQTETNSESPGNLGCVVRLAEEVCGGQRSGLGYEEGQVEGHLSRVAGTLKLAQGKSWQQCKLVPETACDLSRIPGGSYTN